LYAAKVAAYARDDNKLDVRLQNENTDHALYIDTSKPGVATFEGPQYEKRIDKKWLDGASIDTSYRVETFRSYSKLPGDPDQQLRCYFVYKCDFVNPRPSASESDLAVISDKRFLEKATQNTKDIYGEIIKIAVERSGPVIQMFEIDGKRERRLVIAYKARTSAGFFSSLSDLYHYYGLTSSRKVCTLLQLTWLCNCNQMLMLS